jgi:hypothetical protein
MALRQHQSGTIGDAVIRLGQVGTELLPGVYGDVEEPGRIAVGDPVELAD